MSFSADVDWKRVPGWFWLIVIFQCRVPAVMGMRLIMHDTQFPGYAGEGPESMVMSIPALLMVLLFTLQVTRPALCRAGVMLMIVAPLADIVLRWVDLINNGLPEPVWPLVLVVALDGGCAMILAASGRLRQVFWRPEEYED
ncbi:hypothetical protein ACK6VM_18745 [Citrobacter meridianamericanus]